MSDWKIDPALEMFDPPALDRSSMVYWWPRVQGLDGIPMPQTVILEFGHAKLFKILDGEGLKPDEIEKLVNVCNTIGYPLFLRTDQASAKWGYGRTCFVSNHTFLSRNLANLIDSNGCLDLVPEALVIRQYIRPAFRFTAFWGMPIGSERRYMVKDGKVVRHFPYWPKEAIHNANIKDWEKVLEELNLEGEDEIHLLTSYAEALGAKLGGYWSVDFMLGKDGKWWFIDMAEGEKSWTPEDMKEDKHG